VWLKFRYFSNCIETKAGTVALVATVQSISREVDPGQVRALKKAALRASWIQRRLLMAEGFI
jgi:hypothetical protein